jgi:acetylornithine deacetylase/succinyl-diaminopimelate desuccinylase-like protein
MAAMSEIPSGEVVDLLIALVRNACVNDGSADSGFEHRSVATLAAFLGQAGTVVEPHPGRQSVVYRVPGNSPGAPRLLLIPHLDVVPAETGAWTHPPFAGVVADGFVWGRGALDMLNVTAAMAAVFRRYLAGELPPLPGDLIFVGVADEEGGGEYGAHHLVEEHWDLVACDYLLTEVAAPPFRTSSGAIVPVTVAEKGPAWRRLQSTGLPGHASQPFGRENALVPLAMAMSRLGTEGSPVAITDEWRTFVSAIPLDDDVKALLVDPNRVDEAIDILAITDPPFARWVHACTHLTVSPTVLRSGVKSNVIPDLGSGDVDVRMLPGQDETTVDDHFRKVLGPALYDEIGIESVLYFPANGSPLSGPLWEAIADTAEHVTGTRELIPSLTPVTTDARFFRARGIPSYGVGWFDDRMTFGEMLSAFHGIDERVSVDSVGMTANFLADVVASFGRRTGDGT